MGLDMYSYSIHKNDVEIDKDNNSLIVKDYYEQVKKDDLEFIESALNKIDDDTIVYYDSWY